MRWFWTLFLPLFSTAQTAGDKSDWLQKCGVCYCKWNSGKQSADCKNKALKIIPHDLSTELQVVDLSNNIIPELRRDEFQNANLLNLHKIFMRNCTLLELNRDALRGLAILIELDLSHNFIRVLHPGTFNGLLKLRTLVMNNNEIEVLENYLFAKLEFLSRVEFKNNHLKRIDVHAFGQLPTLMTVYLESNKLSMLQKETFLHTSKLLHLSLAQNPWNCTCELKEFRNYAISHRLYTPPTDCHEPRNLHGRLWSEISSEDFACQPRFIEPLKSYMEAQSDNVTLPCRIHGLPLPNVTWLYNKRPLNPKDNRLKVHNTLERNYGDHLKILTSELHIYGVHIGDEGSYSCIAVNRGGRVETDINLLVDGEYLSGGGYIGASAPNASTSETQSIMLLILCLITTMMFIIIIVISVNFCHCRRVKNLKKNFTRTSENVLISSKIDTTHNGSLLEGSVIMEMQKSLLTEVNPVEKPPRRGDIDNNDFEVDGQDIEKTLLSETQIGDHNPDDETLRVGLSSATARSRLTYVDDSHDISLTPDLLSFPARVPTSPSMQSSQTNIPEHVIYGDKSPLSSPVHKHMTPHGIYGTAAIAATVVPNGFLTLQHSYKRNLSMIATNNNRQQQSFFMPAPVVYTPTNTVIIKKGYMTIPRKPRVPSWASISDTHKKEYSNFQSPNTPIPRDTGTVNHAELHEPVYDNLGMRTTAGGNSSLNLHKINQVQPLHYSMRDRPLPATPSLNTTTILNSSIQQKQEQSQNRLQSLENKSVGKIYEPIQELALNSETVFHLGPFYGPVSLDYENIDKIPPRPPPKPNRKIPVLPKCRSQGPSSISQLFEDEGADDHFEEAALSLSLLYSFSSVSLKGCSSAFNYCGVASKSILFSIMFSNIKQPRLNLI